MPDQQSTRDFMQEGEPLFDWEKVVIEKRQNLRMSQPAFEDTLEAVLPTLDESQPESRRPFDRLRERFWTSDGK